MTIVTGSYFKSLDLFVFPFNCIKFTMSQSHFWFQMLRDVVLMLRFQQQFLGKLNESKQFYRSIRGHSKHGFAKSGHGEIVFISVKF